MRKLIFTTTLPIRWGDMDAMGHVNNTVYFRYMEQARIEWFETIGFDTGQHAREGPVIVNASCTFLASFVYPGNVEVRMFFGHPGRSRQCNFFSVNIPGRFHWDDEISLSS